VKPWVAKLFNVFSGEGGILGKVLDKVAKDKISQADKVKLENELQLALWNYLQTAEDNFRTWVLDYEGRASDIPKWVLGIRSTVRPFITYTLAGLWVWCNVYVFTRTLEPDKLEYMKSMTDLLFKLNILSLGFWYGEKLLTRSGLADIFKKNGGK
jgi:hypothetical protein